MNKRPTKEMVVKPAMTVNVQIVVDTEGNVFTNVMVSASRQPPRGMIAEALKCAADDVLAENAPEIRQS